MTPTKAPLPKKQDAPSGKVPGVDALLPEKLGHKVSTVPSKDEQVESNQGDALQKTSEPKSDEVMEEDLFENGSEKSSDDNEDSRTECSAWVETENEAKRTPNEGRQTRIRSRPIRAPRSRSRRGETNDIRERREKEKKLRAIDAKVLRDWAKRDANKTDVLRETTLTPGNNLSKIGERPPGRAQKFLDTYEPEEVRPRPVKTTKTAKPSGTQPNEDKKDSAREGNRKGSATTDRPQEHCNEKEAPPNATKVPSEQKRDPDPLSYLDLIEPSMEWLGALFNRDPSAAKGMRLVVLDMVERLKTQEKGKADADSARIRAEQQATADSTKRDRGEQRSQDQPEFSTARPPETAPGRRGAAFSNTVALKTLVQPEGIMKGKGRKRQSDGEESGNESPTKKTKCQPKAPAKVSENKKSNKCTPVAQQIQPSVFEVSSGESLSSEESP
ncbi:hypothetical protein BU16DRAFT_578659 [Lophium mytilinum]|uniref:Uncharacterized protein n=1 Tax=Lophium mytilinum TaxID=390894 RepID=A0A6A6RAJ6_9PEZI|nr:hypothetical protein BU16DRAFT_578659 [Lophium mytilinum]